MGNMEQAVYIGDRVALYGQGALIQPVANSSKVIAQFDNMWTGYGYGWHEFNAIDFRPYENFIKSRGAA